MPDFSRIYRAPRSQSLQQFLGIGESPAQPDEMARIASFSLPAWHASLLGEEYVPDAVNVHFGYVCREESVLQAAGGSFSVSGDVVPPGVYFWILACSAFHNDPTARRTQIFLFTPQSQAPQLGTAICLASPSEFTPQFKEVLVDRPLIIFSQGRIRVDFSATALNTTGTLKYHGLYLPPGIPPPL